MNSAVAPQDLHDLERELSVMMFDNVITYVGLYSVGAIWPVGPKIEEWKQHVKFTDLRNINGYEFIRPR